MNFVLEKLCEIIKLEVCKKDVKFSSLPQYLQEDRQVALDFCVAHATDIGKIHSCSN